MMRKGIMELTKGNSIYLLRADCGCFDPDHTLTIEIEYIKDINQISLNFYKKFFHINGSKWYERLVKRLKIIFLLLFGKEFITSENFIISGDRQITDFIYGLEKARSHVLTNSSKYGD